MKKQSIYFLLFFIFVWSSCEKGTDGNVDDFDRQAMLEELADNIIIPAFANFAEKTAELKIAGTAFANDPSASNYQSLSGKWETAYIAFQKVSMFDIGKAESLRLTQNLNIYPSNIDTIILNITSGNYNLLLPSNEDSQGFPAIDYLLFGIADSESEILNFYQTDVDASKYLTYLNDLTNRIDDLAQEIINDWNGDYRATFIDRSGNNAISSVNKLTNDFIFFYEKHLRAGKIGIPAGVFLGGTSSSRVEAFHKRDISKKLFFAAFDAVEDFFNGVSFDGSSNDLQSFKTYIEYLGTQKNEMSLAQAINNQLQNTRMAAESLSDSFADQVETDNNKMLATYDQLQLNVVNFKVDMLQAFNISVDFTDSDGD